MAYYCLNEKQKESRDDVLLPYKCLPNIDEKRFFAAFLFLFPL